MKISNKNESKSTHLKGPKISFEDVGKGAIPFIFIHGFPFDKTSWQPQMDFLKSENRVIAYDIRGFGSSTAGRMKKSMQLFGTDLIKFMDALSIEKAIVCGLSMGGYILLNAVERYPDRFEAIILSDTQCIADSEEAKVKRNKAILQIKAEGLTSFADGFINNVFCQESLDNKKDLVEKVRNMILATSPATVTGTLTALAQRSEMCTSLNKILIPTLIMCGKEDKVTPPSQAEFLQSKIAYSTLQIIEKAGHLSNLEQPEEFNKHLAAFIAALPNKNS